MKLGGWAPHELHDHEAEEVARDQAEGVRLAYVAATRARDLLVVPAVGDEPWEGGWLSPLNRALYPPLDDAPRTRLVGRVVRRSNPRTPCCSGRTTSPPCRQRSRPGSTRSERRRYSVVWWDPGALDLKADPPFGLRRGDLVVKDVPKNVVADGRARYDRWLLSRHDAREAGSWPSLAVTTVREFVSDGDGEAGGTDEIEVQVVDLTAPDEMGSGGAAFGTLVHAVLARAPYEASVDALRDIARLEAKLLGLPERDAAVAAAKVARVQAHELWQRASLAAKRGTCRRETPA